MQNCVSVKVSRMVPVSLLDTVQKYVIRSLSMTNVLGASAIVTSSFVKHVSFDATVHLLDDDDNSRAARLCWVYIYKPTHKYCTSTQLRLARCYTQTYFCSYFSQ